MLKPKIPKLQVKKGCFLLYTDNCSQKLKKFPSKASRDMFIGKFLLANQGDPDSWIELVIDGSVQVVEGSGIPYTGEETL